MGSELRRRGIPVHEKGVALGVAPLDATAKIDTSYIPSSIVDGLKYKGPWDASGGTYPVGPAVGDMYKISVAGTLPIGVAEVGDSLICEATGPDTWTLYQGNLTVGSLIGEVPQNGANLGNSEIAETDGVGKIITAAKASGYNKALGTTTGTVAEGKDLPIFSRSIKFYHVSNDNGDDTNGDGTDGKPFKTINKAITVGVASGDGYANIVIDDSVFQNVSVQGIIVTISFIGASSGNAGIDVLTLNDNGGVYLDNIFVDSFVENYTFSGNLTAQNCSFGDTSGLSSSTALYLYGVLMSLADWNNIKAWAIGFAIDDSDYRFLPSLAYLDGYAGGMEVAGGPGATDELELVANLLKQALNGSLSLLVNKGILRGGGNILTVDASGVHWTNSPKAGSVPLGDFSGNPRKATVTFATAFPNANYAVTITGVDQEMWTIESKAAGSFVINSGSATDLNGDTDWIAHPHNDP